MFAKATSNFVKEIDPEGCLIPMSRVNENDNLTLLSVVIKRRRFWFWQQTKYLPSDFTLSHILVGDKPIDPGMIETDFLNYNSTIKNNTSGAAEANFGPGNVNVGGKGFSKLASLFGNLKKQEVEVQKLFLDSKDRLLDMKHTLVQQTMARHRDVFTLVKERIVTTQSCTITEELKKSGSCAAFLGFTGAKKIQVSVKDGSSHSDSNVSLQIPAKTALAYCVMELSVKKTGHFELCLLPDTSGGFEIDGSVTKLFSSPPETPIHQIQKELEKLQNQFDVLSGLQASKRSSLFQQITCLLKDKGGISTLDLALEDLLSGKQSDLCTLDDNPALKEALQTTVKLLEENGERDETALENISSAQEHQLSVLSATHVITSALNEMTDSTLSLLESCCSHPTLQALHLLVQNVTKNQTCSVKDSTLAVLAEEETFSKVQTLFGSSDMTLSKQDDSIQAQISGQQRHSPLILCIAICGLDSLAFHSD